MTAKLAAALMDDLAALAVSANGGYPEKGITEQQLAMVNNYAQNKFLEITAQWEELMGEDWEIQ